MSTTGNGLISIFLVIFYAALVILGLVAVAAVAAIVAIVVSHLAPATVTAIKARPPWHSCRFDQGPSAIRVVTDATHGRR